MRYDRCVGELEGSVAPQAAVTLVVDYENAEELVQDYYANLAVGGLFVGTEQALSKGTPVDVILSFPGLLNPIRLYGIVRWMSDSSEEHGVGIQFKGFDEVARARLLSLITAIRAGDPRVVGRSVNVLLVEENPHTERLVCDGLAQRGHRVFTAPISFEVEVARDITGALDALTVSGSTFDIIIVNDLLPHIEGRSLSEVVRCDARYSEVPIIEVRDADSESSRGASLEGVHLIPRPLTLRKLLGVIASIVSRDEPATVSA